MTPVLNFLINGKRYTKKDRQKLLLLWMISTNILPFEQFLNKHLRSDFHNNDFDFLKST